MSKTRTGFRRPHCLAPVGGGGGYLVTGLSRVNRPFQLCVISEKPRIWPQKSPWAAEGHPSKVRSDSIEARENTHSEAPVKHLFGACRLFDVSPAPSGRRLISGRPPGCQPILFRTPERFSDKQIFNSGPHLHDPKVNLRGRADEAVDVSEPGLFRFEFQGLTPSKFASFRTPSRAEAAI